MLRVASRVAAPLTRFPCRSPFLTTLSARSFALKVGDKRYTKEHEWIKLTGDNEATIGISEHAAKELGDIVYADLPDAGKQFSKGDPFGSVESVKAASSVYAPADLTITSVNESIKDDSGIINKDAEGEGWMIKAKINDTKQLEALLDPQAYAKHVEESGSH